MAFKLVIAAGSRPGSTERFASIPTVLVNAGSVMITLSWICIRTVAWPTHKMESPTSERRGAATLWVTGRIGSLSWSTARAVKRETSGLQPVKKPKNASTEEM